MSRSPVMRMRRLSSGTRVMFWKPSSTGSDLHGSAGGLDLRNGRLAGPVDLHREFPGHLAAAEELDAPRAGALHPTLAQQRPGLDDESRLEPVQVLDVDDGHLFPEDVDEPALRQAPLQRHLAALVARLRPAAAARPETLVPFPGGLRKPGTLPPADT